MGVCEVGEIIQKSYSTQVTFVSQLASWCPQVRVHSLDANLGGGFIAAMGLLGPSAPPFERRDSQIDVAHPPSEQWREPVATALELAVKVVKGSEEYDERCDSAGRAECDRVFGKERYTSFGCDFASQKSNRERRTKGKN